MCVCVCVYIYIFIFILICSDMCNRNFIKGLLVDILYFGYIDVYCNRCYHQTFILNQSFFRSFKNNHNRVSYVYTYVTCIAYGLKLFRSRGS